jgi:hypothetical protein
MRAHTHTHLTSVRQNYGGGSSRSNSSSSRPNMSNSNISNSSSYCSGSKSGNSDSSNLFIGAQAADAIGASLPFEKALLLTQYTTVSLL